MSGYDVEALIDGLFEGEVRGRKGRGGRRGPDGKGKRSPDARGRLQRLVSRTPEVMVKITGSGRNMPTIRAHVAYIARKGAVPLKDERGDTYVGPDAVHDALATWERGGEGIPKTGDKRRESFNIILSMPLEVDRPSVKRAARAFIASEFGGNHSYVFAAHDDTEHPHVHVIVKASGHDGRRLNPRKANLQRWREGFAEQLREQGIAAEATSRAVRGVVRRSKSQAVYHMDKGAEQGKRESPSRILARLQAEAAREIETGQPHENPAEHAITDTRSKVLTKYGRVARALSTGSDADKQLAVAVTRFVQDMPPVTATRHAELVERGRALRTSDRTQVSTVDREIDHGE